MSRRRAFHDASDGISGFHSHSVLPFEYDNEGEFQAKSEIAARGCIGVAPSLMIEKPRSDSRLLATGWYWEYFGPLYN